jgi:hypothetical protein
MAPTIKSPTRSGVKSHITKIIFQVKAYEAIMMTLTASNEFEEKIKKNILINFKNFLIKFKKNHMQSMLHKKTMTKKQKFAEM